MLTTQVSVLLGLLFVLVGGLNVWLVLESWSRVKNARVSQAMLTWHRVGGYVFIALFCAMTSFMLVRLHSGSESATGTLHMSLAMILSPLLFLKVLVARYYRNQHNLLMPLGLAIFILAFVLIASAAGPYLARPSRMDHEGTEAGAALMEKRCSTCHTLDRVVGARKDEAGWTATVNRMRAMPSADIPAADGKAIISYLVSQSSRKGAGASNQLAVERALVDQRCGRCHSLERVYKTRQSAEQWGETVSEMVELAAGSAGAIRPEEQRQILEYLTATQTPETAHNRTPEAVAEVPAVEGGGEKTGGGGKKQAAFILFVCVSAAALVVRRPRARTATPARVATAVPTAAAAPVRQTGGAFLLRLIQVTQQTADAKTLRFAIGGGRALDARPGQFLTFTFLFDGKKETRCYSICSSPARSGYVEITPKRVDRGCVSVYLNDRAALGMTVEATGPFGQFCPDFEKEKKIVLVAAGSGITPMMAVLRYIDDLCLEIDVTLLYCVRTSRDIIFGAELEDLRKRLPGFRYQVMLSQAEEGWTGASGRIDSAFVRAAVPDAGGRVFFLCGPPPFMDAARTILGGLGVEAGQIRQESFGGAGAEPKAGPKAVGVCLHQVEFRRSGTRIGVADGESLLEAATRAGVEIPSACRQGQCGTCKTRVLEGGVWMTAENGLDAESKARGYVLTCVGHAEGNVALDA